MGEAAQDSPALLRGRRVAVVGAGPAGLTLARLLAMRGADGPLVPWPLHVLPAEQSWTPASGVTL